MMLFLSKDKILATEYSFLSHDSYICATNVSRIPKADLVDSIQSGQTRIIDTAFIKRTFFY